jgi:hypothetical protein
VIDKDIFRYLKPLLIGVIQKTERIPEPERRLGANLALEAHLELRVSTSRYYPNRNEGRDYVERDNEQ